jgi:hypothetical protein
MLSRGYLLAIALGLVACADRPPRVVGDDGWGPSLRAPTDDALPPAPRPVAIPPERRVRWGHAALAVQLERVPGRDRSEHIDGRYDRTVRVNAKAHSYAELAGSRQFDEGAVVLQDHHAEASDAVVVTFAMVKLTPGSSRAARDWAFAVVDQELREAAGGDLSLCARCHSEAPNEGLFGPPAMK